MRSRVPTSAVASGSPLNGAALQKGKLRPAPVDVAVIGAGIVGLATALTLSQRHRLSLTVIETEKDVGLHQTGHNSGVIHAGLYYKPGSQRAKNCVVGREMM